jgi:hypothetical protein
VLPLYALAIFVSAALLFVLEPLFARLVLPVLGGSPAVWNTSLAFYQATLLVGYLYAHLTRHLPMRAQVALHAAVLLIAVVVLPVSLPSGAPASGEEPVLWLLEALVVGIGLPFFAVSATSPLLQRWFSRSGHVRAHDPYFLYAASNAGSLIGLLSYPFLLEPRWRLAEQSLGWSAGYVALVALVIAGGVLALRRSSGRTADEEIRAPAGPESIPWRRIARWVLLAAIPSSLLIGVTTYLQTDLSPMPLLWVAPLGLYLATFILAFGRPDLAPPRVLARILPYAVLPMAVLLGRSVFQTGLGPSGLFIVLHLVVFTVVALLCHVQLAEDRPAARHLTSFYLWVALGGALGGSFNALVAPVVFETILEYPIALVAACLLAPRLWRGVETSRTRALDLVLPLAVGIAVAAFAVAARAGLISGEIAVALVLGIPAVMVFSFSRRPLRFGLGVAALLLASGSLYSEVGSTVAVDRTFFGVHRVVDDSETGRRYLFHGSTLHGVQRTDPARALEPTAYYHPTGPYAQAFDELRDVSRGGVVGPQGGPRRVAVVGLGSGGMACLGTSDELWDFYEIDPAVERIARTDFTFLDECEPETSVTLGDGRLQLVASRVTYDVIALDAFSSDAIPVHLLTRDALEAYLGRLHPNGALLFHITNRHLDLEPVLAALARDLGLVALTREDYALIPSEIADGKAPSQLVVMSRTREGVAPLAAQRWGPLAPRADVGVWTDDFSSIVQVFRGN